MSNYSLIICVTNDPRKRFAQLEKLLKFNNEVSLLPTTNGVFSVSSRLYKIRKDQDFIITIGHGPKNLLVLFLAFLFGMKSIMRIGGRIKKIHSESFYRKLRRRDILGAISILIRRMIISGCMRLARSFIIVSPDLTLEIDKYNRPTCIIPTIREPGKLYQRKKANRINLLTVTNLKYKEKMSGVQVILEYLRDFNTYGEFEVQMDIVGGGDYLDELSTFLSEEYDSSRVIVNIHGFQKELEPFYKKADIFVYHSTLDSVPNVILEAMSYQLPVIYYNFEPFKFILDNQGGIPFEDKKSFHDSLQLLCLDHSRRTEMGIHNNNIIENRFSSRANAARIQGFLKEMA